MAGKTIKMKEVKKLEGKAKTIEYELESMSIKLESVKRYERRLRALKRELNVPDNFNGKVVFTNATVTRTGAFKGNISEMSMNEKWTITQDINRILNNTLYKEKIDIAIIDTLKENTRNAMTEGDISEIEKFIDADEQEINNVMREFEEGYKQGDNSFNEFYHEFGFKRLTKQAVRYYVAYRGIL